jgi:signal transduction histidine kinase
VQVKPGRNGEPVVTSPPRHLTGLAAHQRATDLHHLLINSGIALAVTAVAALALGWLIAGHVLHPIRAIIATTERISTHNLHQRLALAGPDDEFTQLADTIDGLLDRLDAAFSAQRRFVAHASHELRTPLTYDRTVLEVALADPHAGAAELRDACEEILSSRIEQERLIDALLTLARGERDLDTHEPIDLAALTGTVAAARRAEAERAGIDVRTRLDPARTTGDPRLVDRLVTNLVDNAIAHNHPAGRVDIRTETRDGRAIVSVANTGPVVPPDQIDRLLQPFQRLGTGSAARPDGHGLGLSIVAAVATAHRAVLTARPRPRGGLDVQVRFPASAVPAAREPARNTIVG